VLFTTTCGIAFAVPVNTARALPVLFKRPGSMRVGAAHRPLRTM